jgi:hypothetical protein
VLQQFHIAVDGQQRVFGEGMEGRKKNAGLQVSVGHGLAFVWGSRCPNRSDRSAFNKSITPPIGARLHGPPQPRARAAQGPAPAEVAHMTGLA